MSAIQSIGISKQSESGIQLEGNYLSGEWEAYRYSDGHILLGKKEDRSVSSIGWCETDVLVAIMHGLVQRGFSGTISLKLCEQQKTIYFHGGQLVFARSDLMDDRLGEVIYRNGLITLEQMMDAAVQVTRNRKFGKVLLESRLFTSSDLWDALKMQVFEIFQSTFLETHVHYVIREADSYPTMSVVFEKSTDAIIEDCVSFGQMFRSFRERVHLDSLLAVNSSQGQEFPEDGTFQADIVELLKDYNTLASYLEHSKLSEISSYLALFQLVMRRLVTVKDTKPVPEKLSIQQRQERREIKSLIDAFHVVLGEAKKAFDQAGVELPLEDLQSFLDKKYALRKTPLFLKMDGTIAAESVRHLYAKCRNSKAQLEIAMWEVQSLIQFLLQIIGDLLPETGWSVKKSIQEMLE